MVEAVRVAAIRRIAPVTADLAPADIAPADITPADTVTAGVVMSDPIDRAATEARSYVGRIHQRTIRHRLTVAAITDRRVAARVHRRSAAVDHRATTAVRLRRIIGHTLRADTVVQGRLCGTLSSDSF